MDGENLLSNNYMEKLIDKREKRLVYCLSFFIPVMMMLILGFIIHLYPFGDKSILYDDGKTQILNFYVYFKSIVLTNNDFSYTLSKFLGGDMAGLTGYYLTNPFLYLLLLFDDKMIPLAIYIIIMLHSGFMGFSFCHFLDVKYGLRKGTLIFTTGYAFIGILFAFIVLPIYLMDFLLAPLAVAGVVKISRKDIISIEYIIALSAMIICNFYQGYMTCYFVLFYFIYILIKEDIISKGNNKFIIKRSIKFIISSIIAVCISAFNLIPVVFSLGGTKSGIDFSILVPHKNYRFINVFSNLYTNAFYGNLSKGAMPYIFIGWIPVSFIAIYFFNKNISLKKKIVTAIAILITLGCTYITTIDIILHGFNEPSGFLYRYSFLISLLLLDIAYESFINISFSKLYFIIPFLMVVYSVYAYTFVGVGITKLSIIWDLLLTIVVICGMYYFNSKYWKIYLIILLVLHCVDMTENAIWSIPTDQIMTMSSYSSYYDRVSPLIEKIKDSDKDLYRIEKDFEFSHNDSMLFNYNGLTHYSSCEKDYVERFAKNMGFRDNIYWTFYNQGSTSFVDSFLGVKYFISRFDTTDKPYDYLFEHEEAYAFKNEYAAPIVTECKDGLSNININSDNLFNIQNEIVHSYGINEDINTPVEVTKIKYINVKETEGTFLRDNPNEEAYIEYIISPSENNNVYLYFTAPREQYTEIFVNDVNYENYFTFWRWNILKIGKYADKTEVSVKLMIEDDNGLIIDKPYFYEEHDDVLAKWAEKVAKSKASLNKITSSHLSGNINVQEDGYIIFTLPYEEGWTIKIDGQIKEYEKTLDAIIRVPVISGEHSIDMKYTPKGRNAGTIISVFSILALIIYLLKNRYIIVKKDSKYTKEKI